MEALSNLKKEIDSGGDDNIKFYPDLKKKISHKTNSD